MITVCARLIVTKGRIPDEGMEVLKQINGRFNAKSAKGVQRKEREEMSKDLRVHCV